MATFIDPNPIGRSNDDLIDVGSVDDVAVLGALTGYAARILRYVRKGVTQRKAALAEACRH